jgi:hypothetical protein
MKRKSVGRPLLVGLLLGLCFILVGAILCVTGIGALVGIPLIIAGLFKGSRRRKVLACTGCGAVVDRK